MKHKILFIFSLLILIACKKDVCDCFESQGKVEQYQISLSYISRIEIFNQFDIYIQQDTVNKAIIECGKNMYELLKLDITDSLLTLKNGNICDFLRKSDVVPKIYLHLTNLDDIFVWGPSKIHSVDTLKFSHLLVRVYGDIGLIDLKLKCYFLWLEYWTATGDAYLSGETTFFTTFVNGFAHVHAFNFKSQYTNINQGSTGDYQVYVTDNLDVKLEDIGNIYYKGDPIINIIEKNSTGKLIKVKE